MNMPTILNTGAKKLQKNRIKKIDVHEKDRLISSHGFRIYHDIWHYSFNDVFRNEYLSVSDSDGRINILRKPLNSWSPVLLYLNYEGQPLITTQNLVALEYDKSSATEVQKLFWYLSLSGFDDFLKRRDSMSSQPSKHFPSSKTYYKVSGKIGGKFHYEDLDRDFFNDNYDKLRNKDFQTGATVVNYLTGGALPVPQKWLKMAYLVHEDEIVAIALLVDDSKSVCIFNSTAKRSKVGYGPLIMAEIIKYCCDHNYYSVDSGVSGKYGDYKETFFMDSRHVVEGGDIFSNNGKKSLPRRVMTKMYQLINFTDMEALHHLWHHIVPR